MSKKSKKPLVPKLRFPEFRDAGEWEVDDLGSLFENRRETGFLTLSLMSLTDQDGIIPQKDTKKKNNSNPDKSKYLRICPGDIAYNTMRMWQGRCAYVDVEGIVSPAYTICKPNKDVNGLFFSYYFKTFNMIKKFRANSQGLVNDTLSLKYDAFSKIFISYPSFSEQQKIADCLTSLDELIAAEVDKLEAYKSHKKGLLQKLFPAEGKTVPEWRFPEFRDTGEWAEKKLSKLLKYERPDKFIVSNTNYIDKGVPVLTANKSFILGYTNEKHGIYKDTPVIIFDDFTVDNKYVDFPFKVKSSAIKILKQKDSSNLKFIFELIGTIKFAPKEHKRYYISVYQNQIVRVPLSNEQQKIANCLTSLDELIAAQTKKIEELKKYKKGLMQGLFPSPDEVRV